MRIPVIILVLCATVHAEESRRFVTVGGAATETVFALGRGAEVVGVDSTSTFPSSVRSLPQVGYQRALSAEGIASLSPDLVILSANAGPPSALEQLAAMKVAVLRLDSGDSVDAATVRVLQIGHALGREREASELVERMERETSERIPFESHRPRVLFAMSLGQGAAMVAGRDTAAAAMLDLVGAVNVASEIRGYSQLSREALVLLDPEIVITTERTIEASGGQRDIAKLLPGLEVTQAGRNSRLVVMDDLFLLGFGPRIGQAARELSVKLLDPKAEGQR